MREKRVPAERLRVVPFPINRPDLLRLYVPRGVTHYLTIYDIWGEEKRRPLEKLGSRVVVLQQAKITSGTHIRDVLRRGGDVSDLVPRFVARYIEENRELLAGTL